MKNVIFTLMLLISLVCSVSADPLDFSGGNGSENQPYIIGTAGDLAHLANQVAIGVTYAGQFFEQQVSLSLTDFSSGEGWNPIGNNVHRFQGSYDGNNKTISNLYINRPGTNYQGLFGNVQGTIRNLGIVSGSVIGQGNTGSLVGHIISGLVENCYSYANVTGNTTYSGGLIGLSSYGNITDCHYAGAVSGGMYVGGLVGSFALATITNCYSTGTVYGSDDYVGGLSGEITSDAIVNNSYSTSNVTGLKYYIGGFTGINSTRSVINNSFSTGNVTGMVNSGENNIYVGGFVGWNGNVINNCYSTGNVTGSIDVGGFVGNNENKINNSYSRGNVNRNNSSGAGSIGGFVGYHVWDTATIKNSYSTGSVSFENVLQNNKGFAGSVNRGYFSNCFWDMESSGQSSSATGSSSLSITGKTTAEMRNIATFNDSETVGLTVSGFHEIWNICAGHDVSCLWNIQSGVNDGYPYLSWAMGVDQTLPVTLSSFTANYTSSNTVNILWSTQSESNLIGYHILRSDNNDLENSVRITQSIIQAYNQSQTNNYSFIDKETQQGNSYYYWLQSLEMDGSAEFFGPIYVKTDINTIDTPVIPFSKLYTAYPNPFNPTTTISFDIAENDYVKIEIYNIKGQKIKALVNKEMPTGKYQIVWDGTDDNNKTVNSGVYFCKMQLPSHFEINKLVMVK